MGGCRAKIKLSQLFQCHNISIPMFDIQRFHTDRLFRYITLICLPSILVCITGIFTPYFHVISASMFGGVFDVLIDRLVQE